jgi:hypothetical protein
VDTDFLPIDLVLLPILIDPNSYNAHDPNETLDPDSHL